ncbi:translocation/assembly module TamB domain-containing protein [Flavisolibacter nicotianae]|uniref:translocation/assembly module TamB domain-containing protein n=1 Tax=Flavisolibacter nicotianae TaxID=2364882 RepID=UPI0013C49185|nr:hypothetical protein [Flavisolibacter nicotianae]
MRRFFKILGRVLLSIVLLLIVIWAFVQTDWGQNWLAGQVTSKLSKDLRTKIAIKHVSIGFFNRMELEGVYVEDQKQDTLLYAGAVKVRITDWFFFKDKADLKYIGLENATIHFNRTDSVWNYGFLAKYFASTDTVKVKKNAGIQFNLQRVELDNVAFYKRDAWAGNDLTVKVGALDLDAQDISVSRQNVLLRNVELTDPYFSSLSYKGKFKNTSSSPNTWTIRVTHASMKNGRFRLDKDNYTPTVTYFDGNHLDFSRINGTADNLWFRGDTVQASVKLSTAERSGFVVKNLQSFVTLQPKAYTFADLLLETPKSRLHRSFSLRAEGPKGFSDFLHSVTMDADFADATISSDDLAYFIPSARNWNKDIRIEGKVNGAVDRLNADDLLVRLGKNTVINGNVSVVGLPDINKTLLNVEAKELSTTYDDAVSFFPELGRLKNPNARALRYLRFKGTFTGFVNDFVSYGTIQTALGTLTTDINMKLPKGGEAVYSGSVSTDGFQLGTLINNKDLGIVDFHGNVKGRSFDWNKISLDIDGIVHRIRYGGYTYQNIKGKGTIKKQQLNGDFTINDPNADLHLNGLIDFSKRIPVFDATAQIRKADLKALQLTKEDIKLKGDFTLNLQGNSLSNLIGTARISNAELVANGQPLSFDFLNVASYYINNERSLNVSSNEFDGRITGDFDISTLPSAFKLFLSRYYPAYIPKPTHFIPQNFTFDITTGLVEDYVRLLDSNLSGLNNSRLIGSLNTTANTMTIDADVPAFGYKQYSFTAIKLTGAGNLDSLVLNGSASDATLSRAIKLPQTTFSIRASNDVSNIVLNTTANQAINRASLAAQVKTFNDGISVLFFPSSFVLNGKTWNIEQGGELNLRKSAVANGQVLLREGPQEVRIETVASDIGSWNDIHVTMRDLNLADLSPLFIKDMRLEGTLSGSIVAENPTEKLVIDANVRGGQIRLDNDSIGDVLINGRYNNVDGMLTARGNNVDPEHKIDFDMAMDFKDSANTFQDRITLRPDNFQLKILERFIGTLFTNIQGTMTGKVDIVGEGDNRDFLAKVRLKNAGFKVVFTQVPYTLEDTDIELKKDYLDLSNLKLHDREGNLAQIKGGITHHGFKNMYFDLAVQTVSRQMELINTTYRDNQQFYGRAKGAGSFVLIGPQYDMNMYIDVKASTTDSSYITLPPAQTRVTGQTTFMVEKKYGREMTEIEKRGGESNITYEVNMTATPLVNVEVVLDELTGDIIKGRGNGTLKITAGTIAPLRLSGRYNIEEGNYLFTFQSVFKRPFIVRKGANNYIEWNGDPYDANIHLDAFYTAEKVSFAPLASTLVVDKQDQDILNRTRENVVVAATLTGKLFSPDIDFRLEFPNSIYSNPKISFAVQQLERNRNELTKQVTFLIVTNSFAPYESTQSVQRPFEELAYNTISGVLFNVINRELNQILSRVLRNRFTLNFSGSLYNRNLFDPNARGIRLFNQATSNISVGTSLFNGRAILSVGGSFDIPLEANVQQTFQILPDVSLQILLNKTGSLRATFFYRQNVDFLNGFTTSGSPQTRRYGTSLSYNKEFDNFSEFLFGRRNPRRNTDSTGAPLVNPPTFINQ